MSPKKKSRGQGHVNRGLVEPTRPLASMNNMSGKEPGTVRVGQRVEPRVASSSLFSNGEAYIVTTKVSRFKYSFETNVTTCPLNIKSGGETMVPTGAKLELLCPERNPDGIIDKDLAIRVYTNVLTPAGDMIAINDKTTILQAQTIPKFTTIGVVDFSSVYDAGFSMFTTGSSSARVFELFKFNKLDPFTGETVSFQNGQDVLYFRLSFTYATKLEQQPDPTLVITTAVQVNDLATPKMAWWTEFNRLYSPINSVPSSSTIGSLNPSMVSQLAPHNARSLSDTPSFPMLLYQNALPSTLRARLERFPSLFSQTETMAAEESRSSRSRRSSTHSNVPSLIPVKGEMAGEAGSGLGAKVPKQ